MSAGPSGFLLIDKPAGLTSARAVDRVKRLLPKGTKVGHAGTLDSFATGLLVLLVGKATRQCETVMGQPKQYVGTIKLGATTATDDPESPEQPFAPAGELDSPSRSTVVTREELQAVCQRFVGTIQQQPPMFSALKVAGRRAADRVRAGQTVELAPRAVRIDSIELRDFTWPSATIVVDCGRGTYIRAIARDVGAALGVGGYLTALRRTRIGDFRVENAVAPNQLSPEMVLSRLLPIGSSDHPA